MESEQNASPPRSSNIFKSWRNSLLGRFSSSINRNNNNNNNHNNTNTNNNNNRNSNNSNNSEVSPTTTKSKNKRSNSSSAAPPTGNNSCQPQPPKQTHPALLSTSSGSKSNSQTKNNIMTPSAMPPTGTNPSPNPNAANPTPPSTSSSSSSPASSSIQSASFPWSMGAQAYHAVHPHHSSISALWNQKWKFPCTKSLYPFHDGQFEDFEPVFSSLISLAAEERDVGVLAGIHSGLGKEYTDAFFSVAQRLEGRADKLLLKEGVVDGNKGAEVMDEETRKNEASNLYLRAAAVLRIARFPYIGPDVSGRWGEKEEEEEENAKDDNLKKKKEQEKAKITTSTTIRANPVPAAVAKQGEASKWTAWTMQKRIYMKAGTLWRCPVQEVLVPHRYGVEGKDLAGDIPVYVRTPASTPSHSISPSSAAATSSSTSDDSSSKIPSYVKASSSSNSKRPNKTKYPTVLLLTGLDGYRPDNTVRCDEFLSRGWACVVAEIPGTADCPADPSDPESGDRVWDSLLAWMESPDSQFDCNRMLAWGLSAGGYHAVRLAHTHRDKFLGVVAQGAGVHSFFDKDWIEKAEGHEYPFALAPAMARKHGFGSVEEYREKVQKKFSLLELGVLKMHSTRLLLVNGTQDGLMPIEDSSMLFNHGSAKEARFFPGALHMGYPLANSAVYPWMEQVMHTRGSRGRE